MRKKAYIALASSVTVAVMAGFAISLSPGKALADYSPGCIPFNSYYSGGYFYQSCYIQPTVGYYQNYGYYYTPTIVQQPQPYYSYNNYYQQPTYYYNPPIYYHPIYSTSITLPRPIFNPTFGYYQPPYMSYNPPAPGYRPL